MVDRHSRINLLCLLLIVVNRISGSNDRSPASLTESTTDPILFDLLLDPNEANPLSTVSTAPHYTDIYTQLVDRANYWGSLVKAAESPDGSMKKVTWKKAGGVVPWLTADNFTAATIDQKYDNTDAPNIVFVLVDDWGWNDVGYRSTYMSWTTPNIDRLAAEGLKLDNYFTSYLCTPSRGALLTGRYPIRLGLAEAGENAELPLSEITLAQEMQSAGYRTYMVGKWHLGYSTPAHTPAQRGFDSSYTYYNGFVDYWSKESANYLDLHNGEDLVTEAAEISSDLHNGYLMETKAENAIADHVTNYPGQPMFLYYAMQLIHGVWSAPDVFLDRCGAPLLEEGFTYDAYTSNVTYQYCALNLMLDEAIGNLTCALESQGMAENTILVIVSDNGGEESVIGNSYPFIGNKGSFYRGGLSGTGLIHSKLLPKSVRGQSYTGQMHVTDWLPTLMGLATNNEWTGSLFGAELDGVNQWEAMTTPNMESPRSEIVHYHDGLSTSSVQIDMIKLNLGDLLKQGFVAEYVFAEDLSPNNSASSCENPSLIASMNFHARGNTQLLRVVHSNFLIFKMLFCMMGLLVVYIFITNFSELKRTGENKKLSLYNSKRAPNDHDNSHVNERSFLIPAYRADI